LINAYRQHHGIFAVSGILYNHESERRGLEFVTRKISHGAAAIKLGRMQTLELGTLTAHQDWGYAPDYVQAMWRMLRHDTPEDFIIATGTTHSVQEVCEIAFSVLDLPWKKYVKVATNLARKTEPTRLVGDATKAQRLLDWQPTISFREMIEKMVRFDYEKLLKEQHG
jgi:GDPmannose 4,6-dehydratase